MSKHSKVKRFDFFHPEYPTVYLGGKARSTGDYVKYKDYKSLQTKVTDLQQQLERECIANGVLCDELNAIKAEARLLREAGTKLWDAARFLVDVKAHKDNYGKTVWYQEKQPKVWEWIRQAKLSFEQALSTEVSDKGELMPDEPDLDKPPCLECGAMTAKECETKCTCAGDKDYCHGCHLWPDGTDNPETDTEDKVLVPRDPTDEMLIAGSRFMINFGAGHIEACYKAMINASGEKGGT